MSETLIPRIEDMPYISSMPVQFVYESTASLNIGLYIWSDTASALSVSRPLQQNTLYYMRHLTLSADISSDDFTAAILTTPTFQVYQKSSGNAPFYREPIRMVQFLESFDFRQAFVISQSRPAGQVAAAAVGDRLLAGFQGTLQQTAALIGKSSITLKATIAAQEIVDRNFINLFRAAYPAPMEYSTQERKQI